jgi:hypothetical protein
MGTGTHQRTKYRYRTISTGIVRGASKIKLKKVNKKRTVTVRRVIIFFEYPKASIADLFTMLSSSVQNSEGRGDGDSGNSFADTLPRI